jgi:hypothetical protein
MISNEHAEQVALVQWARLAAGRWPELAFMFSIPNGAKLPFITTARGKRFSPQAMILLAEGLLPGVADLMIPCARGQYHGLFLEMKYGSNTLSDVQQAFGEAVSGFGYLYAVCWGADEAIKMIEDYMEMDQ